MPIDRAGLGVLPRSPLLRYTREIRVGIDRIWENLLDWEHLPALHPIYFSEVVLLEIGEWGRRVELTKAPGTGNGRIVSELRLAQMHGTASAPREVPTREQKFEKGSSSRTVRFARIGWARSRRPCRKTASCAVHGTVICSMSGLVLAPMGAAIDWHRHRG